MHWKKGDIACCLPHQSVMEFCKVNVNFDHSFYLKLGKLGPFLFPLSGIHENYWIAFAVYR